jgi:hypothetical protein
VGQRSSIFDSFHSNLSTNRQKSALGTLGDIAFDSKEYISMKAGTLG